MSLMQDRLAKSMNLLMFDGVMTVAIDESEMINLSKIMEDVAPDHTVSKVTVVHNPKGSITRNFNRTHEYALFLTRDGLSGVARNLEKNDTPRKMRRWGENSRRIDRRLSFYPIYVQNGNVVDIGTVADEGFHPSGKNVQMPDGCIQVWPIDQDGVERRTNFGLDSIRQNLDRIAAIKVGDNWDLFVTHEQTVPKTDQVQQSTREDYLLNYLLNVESRGSLLSVEDFRKPFDYQLNVAVDSAGAFEPRTSRPG